MILIADTSALLAALTPKHEAHQGARDALNRAALTVVSPLVMTELDHMIRRDAKNTHQQRGAKQFGATQSRKVLEWITGETARLRMAVPAANADTIRQAVTIMNLHQHLALDLADAVSVALASEYDTDAVLTLDREDFRALRPLSGHTAFRLLPEDL
ncbi:PIN domain-containing protein [Streptomyces kanamyceticus]|uniref:Ribonuclease VapC n=1 Tax=Streptomyces kanamyceticus TaxID=1967 RepID=A0A5J6GFP4_STRKN|nr:PIN domain-containing protein [Streptomyces kanamyceticus]QEU93374.1 PIN domain-containing protein [Streptomyces kanamyceticus]